MSLKKDIIEAEFRTTGANKLHHEIGKTEGEIKRLNNENERLRINKVKLEAQGKKNTKAWKELNIQIKKNTEAVKVEKQRLTELNSKLKVTEMSARQLAKKKRELTRELNNTSKALNPKKWNQLNNELKKTTTQYGKVRAGGMGVNSVMKKMGALLPIVGIAAMVAGLKRLGSKIIDVRKEYEKYTAILKVSLGSQKAARKEMRMLTLFAAETPFQLEQLTGSFVKLVNQGFKPSREEMRKLGDLSASMGKDFDQLTEAIIDAQTGEFERLKEFGIRASKQGDQVKFTFKGIETQVKFTADTIQDYILGLGDMEGISGSMAEVSGTLGGRISNLQDAWDSLMNALGKRSSGVLINVINWAIDLVEALQMVSKSLKDIKADVMDELTAENLQKGLEEIDVITQSLVRNGIEQAKAAKRAVELYTESIDHRITETRRALDEATVSEQEFLQTKLNLLVGEKEALKDHFYEVAMLEKKQRDAYLEQYNAEQKTKKEEAAKAREELKKELLAELDLQYQEEMNLLKQQLLNKEITQGEYEDRIIELKIASLELEKEIRQQAGEEIVDISNKILDLEIQIMKKKADEADRIRDEQKKKDDKDAADRKKEDEKKRKQEQKDLDEQLRMYEEKVVAFHAFGEEFGNAIGEALASGGDTANELLKATLLTALKALRTFARQRIIMMSLATGGIPGLIRAAALTALVEGAYTLAKNKISSMGTSEKSNYYAGGPTGLGDKYEPAGTVHKNEYVIPEEGLFNPNLRPFINLIEAARRAGTLKSLNMQGVSSSEFVEGGPTTQDMGAQFVMDPDMARTMEAIAEFLKQLRDQGVVAYIGDPQVRDIRDRTTIIEDIEQSVSR